MNPVEVDFERPEPIADSIQNYSDAKLDSCRANLIIDPVLTAWAGIVLAGCLFPLVTGAVALTIAVIWQGPPPQAELIEVLVFGLLYLILGMIAGAFVGALTGFVSSWITLAVDWSFGYLLSPRAAVSISCGLAAYLAILSMFFELFANGRGTWVESLVAIIIAFFAMLTFHISGMWVCNRVKPRYVSTRKQINGDTNVEPSLQFQIRHLLAATVWFAIVAAIEGMVGNYITFAALGIWIVLQSILILGDRFWLGFCRWWETS